jgi:hypothetical protein
VETSEAASVLEWSVRPVDLEPTKGLLAAGVVLLASAGALVAGGPIMGGVALLVLGGGIGPYYVRTRYRLTSAEVEVRSPFQRVRRPWSAFRRVHAGPAGVSLSPFPRDHLLDPYRSVLLRYGSRRDEILAWVRRFGPAGEATS